MFITGKNTSTTKVKYKYTNYLQSQRISNTHTTTVRNVSSLPSTTEELISRGGHCYQLESFSEWSAMRNGCGQQSES